MFWPVIAQIPVQIFALQSLIFKDSQDVSVYLLGLLPFRMFGTHGCYVIIKSAFFDTAIPKLLLKSPLFLFFKIFFVAVQILHTFAT